jgi:hypothetical protein
MTRFRLEGFWCIQISDGVENWKKIDWNEFLSSDPIWVQNARQSFPITNQFKTR